ncbi:chymotrypsinogen B-like [Ixodes scapularis]|uniref:chymotrypsinogen B-like n=1 Tax=Ixodes scapularis TaxID=6945 RepID=UPI001A9E22E4|nr:chymotrypsinogen B-like [Ixodes scapularis]
MKTAILVLIIFYFKHNSASSSRLTGVEGRAHTEEQNDFYSTVECGRRYTRNTVSERIMNGTVADPGNWPWMVALYTSNDTFRCGGVLISKQYVLTAAHCFANKDASFLSVRLGSTNKTTSTDCFDEQTRRDAAKQSDTTKSDATQNAKVICVDVEEVCVPDQEDCTFFMQDIAILKLKSPVSLTDFIEPICLPKNGVEPSLDVPTYIAGWGKVEVVEDFPEYDYYEGYEDPEEESDDESSAEEELSEMSPSRPAVMVTDAQTETLRQRQICVISNEECKHQLNRTVPDYTVCSTGGTCRGDSGGPLMYEENGKWFLAGIHSASGGNCYEPEVPARHIKASYFVSKLIEPFMQHRNNNEGTDSSVCATAKARVECVTNFYGSYNMSVEPETTGQ